MCAKCEALKSTPPFGRGWHEMSMAPKDGTVIEIENHSGGKPWRRLFRWDSGRKNDVPDDERFPGEDWNAYGWVGVPDSHTGFIGGAFAWRPFAGDPASYSDPYAGFDEFDYIIQGKRPTAKLVAAEIRYVRGL